MRAGESGPSLSGNDIALSGGHSPCPAVQRGIIFGQHGGTAALRVRINFWFYTETGIDNEAKKHSIHQLWKALEVKPSCRKRGEGSQDM